MRPTDLPHRHLAPTPAAGHLWYFRLTLNQETQIDATIGREHPTWRQAHINTLLQLLPEGHLRTIVRSAGARAGDPLSDRERHLYNEESRASQVSKSSFTK